VLLSAGLIAVVVGIMGALLTCCKTKKFAGFFGYLLMISWIFLAASGALASTASVGA
jgi:hypothetical protein